MIKNQLTNQILKVERIDLINNYVYASIRLDFYALKISETVYIPVPTLYNIIIEIKGDSENTLYNQLCDISDNIILSLPKYENWIKFYNELWHEPDWEYRFYVTNDQSVYLTLNYKEFVDSLYTEPVNPKYTYSEGVLIYAHTIDPNAQPLLDALGIIVETKPIEE